MRHRSTRQGGPAVLLLLVIVLGVVGVAVVASGLGASFVAGLAGGEVRQAAKPGLGTAIAVQPTPAPPTATPTSPTAVASEYLKAWEQRRYADMYALLAKGSKAGIDEQKFVARYTAIADAATVTEIKVVAGQPQTVTQPNTGRVPFDLTLKTVRLGEIKEANTLPLIYEDGRWGVQWSPTLIFKDLSGDNLIRMFPINPQRGSILDRQGRPLATQGYVVQVGVVPGDIKDRTAVVNAVSGFTKVSPEDINKKIDKAQPDWFVPIKDVPMSQEKDAKDKLESLEGVMLQHKSVRTYPNGDLAAHVVGYVSKVSAEDLEKLRSKGYEEDDIVGRDGIEAWAEEQLVGQRGGKLAVVSAKGEVVKIIAEQPARRGFDVHLTIDIDIQRKAEQALGDKLPGSIVVMDPRDNALLALASFPRFDPNMFVRGMTDAEWNAVSSDTRHPLLNRPAIAAYATGSVFKIVTYSGAIERMSYGPYTPTDCPGAWTIPSTNIIVRDLHPEGHGVLPFPETLSESCNVPFYKFGFQMNGVDPNMLPSWTKLWGYGEPTGTVGLIEAPGIVPDPAWKDKVIGQPWFPGDAVNLSIGQGFFQATPLQMANTYSTLANRGSLRTPLLVRKVTTVEGQVVKAYVAEEKGRVPLSEATLKSIHDGLLKTGSTPKGTGYYAFSSFKTPLASKTGSAENQGVAAHAWFAGYAPADNPTTLVAVMIEAGQAGGTVAAPVARQVMDYLFPAR